MNSPKIQKTLFIRHDQLMDDITMQIELVAEMRPNEDGSPNQRLVNVSTRYATMLNRWIDKYMNMMKSHMAAYIVTMDRHAVMNAQREWDEYVIHLAFPPSWNPTTFTNLADAVHQFIVNSVLAEFFILIFTSKDPVTSDKQTLADESWLEVKHCCVSQLPGRAKKTLHPF